MMKHLRSKSKAIVALVLVLTMAAMFMACLPAVNAVDIPTYAFLSVTPNPVGVGQPVTVSMWLSRMPQSIPGVPSTVEVYFWDNFMVTITDPDGTTSTIGPYKSDYVGAQWDTYVPDQVGKWYFELSFPGQQIPDGDYYEPSTSAKVELTVQQESVPEWPAAELPTDYWDRPIDAGNREWWSISGNWLMRGCNMSTFSGFNPYTKTPNTAHIVWTREHGSGGLVGGHFGSIGYSPEWLNALTPPVIMNGKLYYNARDIGFYCVDLRTGETLWYKDYAEQLTFGQILDFESKQQHGARAYLWSAGRTWRMYDAFTGNWILDLENARSAGGIFAPPSVYSPTGEILFYILDGRNNYLAMWNLTEVEGMVGAYGPSWSPPRGATLDWTTGIQYNVTVPDVPGTQSVAKYSTDVIYARTTFTRPEDKWVIAQDVAYSIKPDDFGQVLFGPVNRTAQPSRSSLYLHEGVFMEYVKETMKVIGYDVYTGEELWVSEPYTDAFDMYEQESRNAGYGKLYHGTYAGMMHCIDVKTGEREWDYYAGSSGLETPYGSWPFYGGTTVAGGKVFAVTGEHTPGTPLWRGERMHVIDVETGDLVWNILGWWQGPAVAEGYAVTLNAYDNQIYCFGKGKTATTVTASPKSSVEGTSVVIEGTVTDQSPGAKGTPAIADASMTEWMEYLYMQKPIPADAKGVEVTLDTIDPNGNWIHIGRVTTDMSGMFSHMWTPEVPGKYTVIATFEGSDSYWASYAETAVGVSEAPPPVPVEEPEEEPAYTAIDLAIIAAIVVVAILVLYTLWTVRKQRK